MPLNLLSDVDVVAISLVDKGANRKRFFLRKQDESRPLINLPAHNRIVKSADWSVVYAVVAEPGWTESPGQGAPDPSVDDIWKDADEIRRAAHRFMYNGALVNKMHESLEPYGRLVENFIAPVDMVVEGEVLKAGSWIVGIEPNDDGKRAIESGEFTGISIQGTGVRTLQKSEEESEGTLTSMEQVEKESVWRALGRALGIGSDPDTEEPGTVERNEGDPPVSTEAVSKQDFDDLKESVEKSAKSVEQLANRVADIAQALAERDKKEDDKDPAQEVYHRLDEVAKSIEDIRNDVEVLAKGSSTQPASDSQDNVNKSDHPLAGIL